MRLLLVEDDAALVEGLRAALAEAGYAVDVADNGVDGAHLGAEEPYDAVILDLGLPRRPGLEVLREWRSAGNGVPVVILTARDSWQEKVEGLKAGADDYLAKPFQFPELLARLQAVVRRHKGQASGRLQAGGFTLDEEHQQVIPAGGTPLELTGTEFRLLRVFMLHPGRILSRTQLYEHAYGYAEERDSNVIEVYVRRLRDKLGAAVIETRRGQGYLFRDRAG
ncbi:MAG TPA: response regulator transcription factor [Gammaproteobacteria bacterium]